MEETGDRMSLCASVSSFLSLSQDEDHLRDYSLINALEDQFAGQPLPQKLR